MSSLLGLPLSLQAEASSSTAHVHPHARRKPHASNEGQMEHAAGAPHREPDALRASHAHRAQSSTPTAQAAAPGRSSSAPAAGPAGPTEGMPIAQPSGNAPIPWAEAAEPLLAPGDRRGGTLGPMAAQGREAAGEGQAVAGRGAPGRFLHGKGGRAERAAQWQWAERGGTLGRGSPVAGINCWSEPDERLFSVRSRTYLADKVKQVADAPLMTLVAVDWVRQIERVDHVAGIKDTPVQVTMWPGPGHASAGRPGSCRTVLSRWGPHDARSPGDTRSRPYGGGQHSG